MRDARRAAPRPSLRPFASVDCARALNDPLPCQGPCSPESCSAALYWVYVYVHVSVLEISDPTDKMTHEVFAVPLYATCGVRSS